MKWLNERHIESQLKYSNLREVTLKYPKCLRKQRQELQDCNKQQCRKFLREDFAVQIIMDCRTTPSINFKSRLGFKIQDPIMTQEQSILTKLDIFFKTEDKLLQDSVSGYKIDLYVPKYKLVIEVDEKGHCDRDLKQEIKRQQKIEKELGCKFIRIDPSKETFNIIDEICKIHHYIVELREKSLTKIISNRLLKLGF